jgi:hypothetical protein
MPKVLRVNQNDCDIKESHGAALPWTCMHMNAYECIIRLYCDFMRPLSNGQWVGSLGLNSRLFPHLALLHLPSTFKAPLQWDVFAKKYLKYLLEEFQVASGSVSNSWITSTTILRTSRLQPRHTLFFGCISKDFKTSHVSSVAPRDSKWIKMPSCHKPYHIFPSQDEAPSDGHVWICNSRCW